MSIRADAQNQSEQTPKCNHIPSAVKSLIVIGVVVVFHDDQRLPASDQPVQPLRRAVPLIGLQWT